MQTEDRLRAARELQAFARQFRNILRLADDLDQLAQLEKDSEEAQQKSEDLKQVLHKHLLNIDAAKSTLADIQDQQKSAQAEVDPILRQAREKAKVIVDNATLVLSKANAQVEQARSSAAAGIKAKTEVAEAQMESMRKEISNLGKEITEKTEQLARLRSAIDSLKENLGKLTQ